MLQGGVNLHGDDVPRLDVRRAVCCASAQPLQDAHIPPAHKALLLSCGLFPWKFPTYNAAAVACLYPAQETHIMTTRTLPLLSAPSPSTTPVSRGISTAICT